MTTDQPRPAAQDEGWDTKTTYSVQTLSDNPKSQYLQAFASQLEQDIRCGSEGGCIDNVGTKCLDFALREFAWKLHEESSNPFQREASVTINRKRKDIIELLVPHLSDMREESTISGDEDENERSSRRRFQKSNETVYQWACNVELGQPIEDDQFLHYEEFIRESDAYHWLLTRIRQYSQLTFEISDVMLEIGTKIRNELRTQTTLHKMSSREPPSLVAMTFDLDWNPSRFMHEHGLTLPLEEALRKTLCLTGSWNEAQAATVLDYMDQTWPHSGRALIALLQKLVCAAEGEECSCIHHEATHRTAQPASKAQLTASIHSPSVCSISVTGGSYLVSEIGEQIAWMASTLRSPPANLDMVACTPRIKNFHAAVQGEGSPTNRITASCSLIFEYEVPETSDSIPGFCWSRLFYSPTLVRGYPILQRSEPGTGLEMPLSNLANIIGAHQVVQWGDKFILKGFNMLMVATLAAADIIIWHLLISEDPDQRMSYTDSKLNTLHIETSAGISLRMLETKRHVVGWCSEAKDMCGDAAAVLNIQPSGLPIPPPSIVIDKLYLEAGTMAVGGLSWGINKKEKPFWLQRENDYPSMLKWISLQPVLFYDVAEHRAWLIDGASALLHLTRISLFLDEHDRESPYEWVFEPAKLKDRWDGLSARQAALETLKNRDNLNLNVYVVDEHRGINGLPEVEYSTLKDRVKKILSSLEILIDRQASVASQDGLRFHQTLDYRRNIIGFDILDIVDPVGPVHPRIKHLKSWSYGWAELTKSISTTTIFGCGFGDLIRPPETSRVCKKWKSVPEGGNYMAASVSTLRMLYERRFLRLEPGLSGGDLTGRIVWMALDHPFAPCRCSQKQDEARKIMIINPESKGGVEGACYNSPVQFLIKKSRRRIGIRGATPLNPTMLNEKGAVIFAQAAPPSWKADDISVSEQCDDDGDASSSSVERIQRPPVITPVTSTDASGSSRSEGSTTVTVPSETASCSRGIQSQGDIENNVSGSGETQSKGTGWRTKFWKKSQMLLKRI
ncbi:hypothetical protein B0T10DRAFT_509295 [Thelonectria olida]|uniref:Uncharacterized protein n=1 Tax=Thelonectria olida TaxID=1576542 RepID=A0A9P8WB08_9HYPO|nr:hypothetical protein B0T10DRAFT_509295 [Thelonectria olida]